MTKKSPPPFVKRIIALMVLWGVTFFCWVSWEFANLIAPDAPGLIWISILATYFGVTSICAYGLRTMKPWARKATIGTLIAIIIFCLGILAILIFYRAIRNLLKPETKAAYEG